MPGREIFRAAAEAVSDDQADGGQLHQHQTLKTFSTVIYEDRYVADSDDRHGFPRLMRVFRRYGSNLFMMNSGLVIAIAGLSLPGGTAAPYRRSGGDRDPFSLRS